MPISETLNKGDTDSEAAEIERLKERVRRLAEEKSYLQLILRMIEQINPMPGMHDMVSNMLHNIVESIGGTDIKIWYWLDNELRYASFLGDSASVSAIDDPTAYLVSQNCEFIESCSEPNDSLMRGGILPGAWTWWFPLLVGQELIGVVKLENVHITGASLRNFLPIFFSHAALILSNEIRNHLRQQDQEALREKTEELDNYFNSALDLFCIANTDGYFLKLNPAWSDALGYALADLQGKRFLDFVHPDDMAATLAVLEQLTAQQMVMSFINRYRHKNGSWRWIEWHAQPRGAIVFAAARDITDKKYADDALRLAASVFANSQEGIVITDADNHIIEVNNAFCRICGYEREEVIGLNPAILRSGRQDAAFYADMWQAIQEKGSWRGEIWNRRKSGEVYAEMLSIDAVRDQSGQIQHYVGAFSDISLIKEHQAELERIAHYDTLTGLPNRRLLADRLGQELARSRRTGRILGICFLDLDGFKPVNDHFGHEAGDNLLIEIAHRLQKISRAGDTVARIGGDEFVILFCDLVQEQECFLALERLLATVATPFAIGDQQMSVSASVGVTLFPHDDADDDTLLRHADQAMYQAKEAGKGRFHLFDAEHDRQLKANRDGLQQLEQALLGKEFILHYQPKVDMTNGQVIGAEALIRWQHPERGLLFPAEFLPLLMGSELEIELGEWVIESALVQLERWCNSGLNLVISVNIGANQLLRPDFMTKLAAALARHPDAPAKNLELEILESDAIDDLGNAARTLAGCIAMGVHFALDDFGTGYSSLTYFRKLPVGTLKIDQGFVCEMLDNPEDLGIIENVIGLAKAFNRPVIAEGVETMEHAALLVLLGCSLGQGYGIARPMPAAQLAGWIEQWHSSGDWRDYAGNDLAPEDRVLSVAARSQGKWGERVQAYIEAPLSNSPPPLQPQHSPFGRWYYGSGISRYGHLPEFNHIEVAYQAVFRLANELIRLAQSGKQHTAQTRLPELAHILAQLQADISGLIQRVRSDKTAKAGLS